MAEIELWFYFMMTAALSPHLPHGLPRPTQARSRRTLERVIEAATRLLDEQTFEELTIAQVVERAGSSVGSFYARFGDKAGLLDTLDEIYAQELIATVEELIGEAAADPPADLADAVRHLFRPLVDFHRERRGLIRALVLEARAHRAPRFEERTRRMNRLTPQFVEHLLRHRGEIARSDVRRAAELGFAMAYTVMRERILFPESIALAAPPTDAELVEEITRLLVGYLGMPDAMGRRSS
ncbi:MAG TPA: TetR/AcrR family transcriptional regulator [Thermoanaerobaculia bacterium]|nr:TetR/AcrR family transcriptional regulator [Thermoanaerobaculia bacterium]